MKPRKLPNYTFWYAVLGFVFGLIFAVVGTLLAMYSAGLAITLDNLIRVVLTIPLLWLVYSLPFFMAVVMGIAGARQKDLVISRQRERNAARAAIDLQQQTADLTRRDHERQELDAVISRGKKEWEATFDSVEDLILLTDQAGVITRCNRAAAQAFHIEFPQVIGKNVNELFFGSAVGEQNRLPLQKSEMKFPTLDGWFQVSSNPVVSEGLLFGTIYVIRNISDYKQAALDVQRQKQFYESLVNNNPLAIVTLNLEQRIVACNPAFEKMFGYRQQDVIGQDLDSLIAPYELVEETRAFTDRVGQGELVHAVTRRRRMEGSQIDVEVFGVPVILWGKQIGILGMYHDITEFVRPSVVVAASMGEEVMEAVPEDTLVEEMGEEWVVEEPVPEETAPVESHVRPPAGYKIVTIEGIGPVYARALEDVGIVTTEDLLDVAATRKGRADLAEKTGLSLKLILKWANKADLMRVPGVGEEFSDLLEAAGVDTVKELRNRNPENLYRAMLEKNEEKSLVRRAPFLTEVQAWVQAAKEIEPRMTY